MCVCLCVLIKDAQFHSIPHHVGTKWLEYVHGTLSNHLIQTVSTNVQESSVHILHGQTKGTRLEHGDHLLDLVLYQTIY